MEEKSLYKKAELTRNQIQQFQIRNLEKHYDAKVLKLNNTISKKQRKKLLKMKKVKKEKKRNQPGLIDTHRLTLPIISKIVLIRN